ncbi:MAG: TIR domain-containing protein [Opitutaceae bacterium]|nr:TIR domain-containing protein [Opitutaceae bacterium]
MSSAENKAVFLSYASQDAAAVLRICEALRTAGIEVWFDQNELVGGDAWDAKIRGQIASCALFVPVISAATQARLEGYFRIEWKLAAQRTHAMAEEKAFVLPVVIDDTRDAEAKVPVEFKAVQWTRLPGGEGAEKFCQRVKKLLGSSEIDVGPVADRAPGQRPGLQPIPVRRKSPWSVYPIIAVAAVVAHAFWQPWKSNAPPAAPATASPLTASPSPAAAPVADQKSVAVLPFVNGNGDKENEFFSDGISEELINALLKIPGLKVPASTSSFHFKGKDTPIAEIARQLNVAHVVEGNVRKVGTRVRINAKLIKVADGFPVWSSGNIDLDRELKDVLALQEEIAGRIAQALQLKLGGVAVTATVNPEAYQHLLQARFYSRSQDNEGWRKAVAECRAALALDPNYAAAAAEMARSYIFLCRFGGIPLAEGFLAARLAAERAITLDPESPEANNALAWVQRTADWDWQRADASFRRAYERAPRSADMILDYAVIRNNLGFLSEAVELGRRAVELDPLNAYTHACQGLFLAWSGRLEEASAEMKRGIELAPTAVEWPSYQTRFLVMLGRIDEAAAMAELEPSESYRLFSRGLVLLGRKNRAAADHVIRELSEKHGETMNNYIAELFAFAGETDHAFEWLERARVRRETAMVWLRATPAFRPLHPDPRWTALLRKLGMPDGPTR